MLFYFHSHIDTLPNHFIKYLNVLYRSSLYRGLVPALVTLWCSNFVYFYTYDCLKAVYLEGEKSSPVKDLTFAYIAGK